MTEQDLQGLQALFDICRATYTHKAVHWFEGDDDDAPGWRAYVSAGNGPDDLLCVCAPPRLSRQQAEADLPHIGWELGEDGEHAWTYCNASGRDYGKRVEDCGPDSIFGVDIPESQAEAWAAQIREQLVLTD